MRWPASIGWVGAVCRRRTELQADPPGTRRRGTAAEQHRMCRQHAATTPPPPAHEHLVTGMTPSVAAAPPPKPPFAVDVSKARCLDRAANRRTEGRRAEARRSRNAEHVGARGRARHRGKGNGGVAAVGRRPRASTCSGGHARFVSGSTPRNARHRARAPGSVSRETRQTPGRAAWISASGACPSAPASSHRASATGGSGSAGRQERREGARGDQVERAGAQLFDARVVDLQGCAAAAGGSHLPDEGHLLADRVHAMQFQVGQGDGPAPPRQATAAAHVQQSRCATGRRQVRAPEGCSSGTTARQSSTCWSPTSAAGRGPR